ncbi:hypothetical protein FGB62_132g021 [Gracilaria domingensis]|nr:hypothetical protein FGB62_132g021 [Gracilaria domingensis]
MRGVFSVNAVPSAQQIDTHAASAKPSLAFPSAAGCPKSSKLMQAATWSSDSVEDDTGSTDAVWNSEKGTEVQNRQDINDSDHGPMVSSLFLNFETERKWERRTGLLHEHPSGIPRAGVPCEASRVSLMLSDILKVALSPVFNQEKAEATSEKLNGEGEGFKRTRYGPSLTEEERRAERNRKGRERSMRTRQRNAAHMKMLEDGCTRLISENRLLRDLLNCLQRVPLAEENVISLFRNLLSPSRLPSSFHPALERLESFAAPSESNTALTHHRIISSVEHHNRSYPCEEVRRTCALSGNETQMENAYSTKNVDLSASLWEPKQNLEGLPESSNVSKTSMTTRKSPESRAESVFEAQLHDSDGDGDETHEEDRSVLANFSLDEIDAVIHL